MLVIPVLFAAFLPGASGFAAAAVSPLDQQWLAYCQRQATKECGKFPEGSDGFYDCTRNAAKTKFQKYCWKMFFPCDAPRLKFCPAQKIGPDLTACLRKHFKELPPLCQQKVEGRSAPAPAASPRG